MVAMEVIDDKNSKKNSRDVASQIKSQLNNSIVLNETLSEQLVGNQSALLEMQRQQLKEIQALIESL